MGILKFKQALKQNKINFIKFLCYCPLVFGDIRFIKIFMDVHYDLISGFSFFLKGRHAHFKVGMDLL